MPSQKQSHARSGPTFLRGRRRPDMAGSPAVAFSTREKLERARGAATVLAQLSTEQKNDLLLKIADALETHAGRIVRANEEDIQRSNLAGAMRDRLLLTPERISQLADAVRDVAA